MRYSESLQLAYVYQVSDLAHNSELGTPQFIFRVPKFFNSFQKLLGNPSPERSFFLWKVYVIADEKSLRVFSFSVHYDTSVQLGD